MFRRFFWSFSTEALGKSPPPGQTRMTRHQRWKPSSPTITSAERSERSKWKNYDFAFLAGFCIKTMSLILWHIMSVYVIYHDISIYNIYYTCFHIMMPHDTALAVLMNRTRRYSTCLPPLKKMLDAHRSHSSKPFLRIFPLNSCHLYVQR